MIDLVELKVAIKNGELVLNIKGRDVYCRDGVSGECVRLCQIPAVDAAPVIRCKDCKYYTNNMHDPNLRDGFCRREQAGAFYHVKDNDFCSFGAKMDGGND